MKVFYTKHFDDPTCDKFTEFHVDTHRTWWCCKQLKEHDKHFQLWNVKWAKFHFKDMSTDGKIHHTLQYDGSKNAVNHYFTPVSQSDLEECLDCEFFGTWKMSFRSNQGMTYLPITFEVINSED